MMLFRTEIRLLLLLIVFPRWVLSLPVESDNESSTSGAVERDILSQGTTQHIFDLIYFGNTRGVSAHQSIEHLTELDSLRSPYSYRARGPYAYVCNRFIIAREGPLTIKEFQQALLRFLAPTEPDRLVEVVPGLISPFHFVLTASPSAELPQTTRSFTKTHWHSRELSTDKTIRLYYPKETSVDEFVSTCSNPSAWQVRYAAHGLRTEPPGSIITIRRPLGDGVARTQDIRTFLGNGNLHDPVVLSAGNNFEGLSFLRPNAPDQQRTNTRASLALMQAEVLMVGNTEAMFDAQEVQTSTDAKPLSQVKSLDAYTIRKGQREIILLNLNLDSMQKDTFLNAVKVKIDTIRRSSLHHSFIIGVGVLNQEYQALLSNDDIGLDLLICDFSGTPYVPNEMTLKAALPIVHPLQISSVGTSSWGHLRLTFDGKHLNLEHRIFPVLSNSLRSLDPHVENLMHDVNRIRHTAFQQKQTRFIPHLPAPYSDADGWRRLSLLALQDHLSTDIAVLPKLPVRWSINDPILTLTAIANLPISDQASVLTFDGKSLHKLIKSEVFQSLVSTGLNLKSKKVGGRSISTRRWYTVATTRSLADAFTSVAPAISRHDVGAFKTGKPSESSIYIQSMILETMPMTVNRILQSTNTIKKVPEWYLDFEHITLGGNQLHRLGSPETYNDVPEPRLTTQDFTQVTARGKITLGFDSDALTSLNYIDAVFAKSYLEQGPPQETDDRLEFGSELVINRPVDSGVLMSPFIRTAYLTEFTAAELEGVDQRKSRLESVAGSFWKWDKHTHLRLGATIAVDFAVEKTQPQYGLYSQFGIQREILGLKTFAEGEIRYYPPQFQQLASQQLQLFGDAEVGFLLPLWRRLSIRSFIGGFFYQSPPTYERAPGLNVRGGFALNFDHLIPL